jgi:hypothetical protein
VNAAIEAGLKGEGDEMSVLAVSLDRRGLGERLHTPAFDANRWHLMLDQAVIQILC